MTYAAEIKTSLVKTTLNNELEEKSLLSAIIRSSGELKLGTSGRLDFSVSTENNAVARFILKQLKNKYNLKAKLIVKKNRSLKKHLIYEIVVEAGKRFLVEIGVVDNKNGLRIVENIPPFIYQSDKAMATYLRGLFLGGGSVNNPAKAYHFEIVIHSQKHAESVINLMEHFNLSPKLIIRKNNYVIYLKDSQQIVEVLGVIGAFNALLDFENVRLVKSIKNRTNRMYNCDNANLKRSMDTAQRQIKAIKLIEEKIGLDSLPASLLECAILRRDYPEMNLTELGEMFRKTLGKSGVNHRLKKIEKIAAEIEEEENA